MLMQTFLDECCEELLYYAATTAVLRSNRNFGTNRHFTENHWEIDKIGYTRVVSEQNRVVRGEPFLGAVIDAVLRGLTPKKRFGVLRAHKA